MGNRNEKSSILLVDDDQTVLSLSTLIIQRSGYKVLQATSGTEAIQIFQNYIDDICLVILDEILPNEHGSDICMKLKESQPDMKVLHISGLGRVQGFEGPDCGCNDFLEKPFRIEELSNKMEEMLADT